MTDEIKRLPAEKLNTRPENQPERPRRLASIATAGGDPTILQQDSVNFKTRPASQNVRNEHAAKTLAADVAERILKDPAQALGAHQVYEGMKSLL